jgi:hypothetical protein
MVEIGLTDLPKSGSSVPPLPPASGIPGLGSNEVKLLYKTPFKSSHFLTRLNEFLKDIILIIQNIS